MKKKYIILAAVMLSPVLAACSKKGSSAPPPTAFAATAGDARVTLTWNASPGVEYWLFTSTDPNSTISNWSGSPASRSYNQAVSPFYMCGLYSGTPYYVFANGRINSGAGGPTTATISATPYDASTHWIANSAALSQNLVAPNLNGVGYTSLATCSNNAMSASGAFVAVGAGGAIFTSADGKNWVVPNSLPNGFSSDLYAVTGYAVNQNAPTNPGLRWVAVGAGGSSLYSTDGIAWNVGRGNYNNPALRALTQVAGVFFAVGDAGTIVSSSDGITWTSRPSGTSSNLRGVTHGNVYVAVGDNGTILTSSDSNLWGMQSSGTTNTLRQVAAAGNIIVAVGDKGAIVTSINGGVTWTAQSLSGAPNLAGVAVEPQTTLNAVADPLLGFVSGSLFVVADSSGNVYTSTNGLVWSGAIRTGVSGLNALVSSGFGYVAVGNAGAAAAAF